MKGIDRIVLAAGLLSVIFLSGFASTPTPEPASILDAMTDKGLEYLLKSQQKDGCWEIRDADTKKMTPIVMKAPKQDTWTSIDVRLWTASCAALAFLADGATIDSKGKYSEALSKAIDYVVANVENPECARSNHSAYTMPFVELLFAELIIDPAKYPEEKRKQLLPKLQKLVDANVKGQQVCEGHNNGAWGYGNLDGPRDGRRKEPSVTAQIMGLYAARRAGAKVPQEAIDRGLAFLKRCSDKLGALGYQDNQVAPNYGGYFRTSSALYCFLMAGKADWEEYKKGVQWLDKQKPTKDDEGHNGTFTPWAFFSGAVYAMHRPDGNKDAYFKARTADLAALQRDDGSWSKRIWSSNPIAAKTGMVLVSLLIPKGNLKVLMPEGNQSGK